MVHALVMLLFALAGFAATAVIVGTVADASEQIGDALGLARTARPPRNSAVVSRRVVLAPAPVRSVHRAAA